MQRPAAALHVLQLIALSLRQVYDYSFHFVIHPEELICQYIKFPHLALKPQKAKFDLQRPAHLLHVLHLRGACTHVARSSCVQYCLRCLRALLRTE